MPSPPATKHAGGTSNLGSAGGALPEVPRSVRLHSGWFNHTLATFLDSEEGSGPVAFAHLDCDVYESTRPVLDLLASRCRLRVGTVLAFDELFGSQLVEQHEWRALREAARCWGFRFRPISYMAHSRTAFGRAAVQISDAPQPATCKQSQRVRTSRRCGAA